MSSLKTRINEDVKNAMRERERERLGTLRMTLAAIKQREVDERIELTDNDVIAIIEKMVKQRRESIEQYRAGARNDLADKEAAEIEILRVYLPEPLDEQALKALIDEVITASGASGMQDMGKVMGQIKSRAAGRADMSKVSALVRSRLSD